MSQKTSFHTTALKRAARGETVNTVRSDRAVKVYGLSNFALKKSAKELKDAWFMASSSLRNS